MIFSRPYDTKHAALRPGMSMIGPICTQDNFYSAPVKYISHYCANVLSSEHVTLGVVPGKLRAPVKINLPFTRRCILASRVARQSNTVEYSLSSRLAIEAQRQPHLGNFILTGVLRDCRKITSAIRPLLRTARSVARRSNTDVFSLLAPCWPHAATPSVLHWLFRDSPLASNKYCPVNGGHCPKPYLHRVSPGHRTVVDLRFDAVLA